MKLINYIKIQKIGVYLNIKIMLINVNKSCMQSFIEIGQPIKEEMGVNTYTYAMDTLPSLQSDLQIKAGTLQPKSAYRHGLSLLKN